MSKRLEVYQDVFTVTDTVTGLREFQSVASVTYLTSLVSYYYFYYDTFSEDSINKSRSVDYILDDLVTSTGIPFQDVASLQEWVAANLGPSGGGGGGGTSSSTSSITDYRSEFDVPSSYIYSGYNKDGTPFIIRYIDGVVTTAENVTDLESDWINRLILTYI